jgi:hypothetical protein
MATFLFCGGEGVLAQAPITGVIGTLDPRHFPVFGPLTGKSGQSGVFSLILPSTTSCFPSLFCDISLF